MSPKENLEVPAGYLVEEITAGDNGVVTLWRSPDGKDRAWTFDGPIRKALEKFARRQGVPFETAARALAETRFDWMMRYPAGGGLVAYTARLLVQAGIARAGGDGWDGPRGLSDLRCRLVGQPGVVDPPPANRP
jgi:hypothetical protein